MILKPLIFVLICAVAWAAIRLYRHERKVSEKWRKSFISAEAYITAMEQIENSLQPVPPMRVLTAAEILDYSQITDLDDLRDLQNLQDMAARVESDTKRQEKTIREGIEKEKISGAMQVCTLKSRRKINLD